MKSPAQLLEGLGYYDPVKLYQRDAGLHVDGLVGPQTRCSLLADTARREVPGWEAFRGSLGLLVRLEGHRGHLYWPGGNSGVTLDPGWDLANGREELTAALYEPIFGEQGFGVLKSAFGLRGADAQAWIEEWRPSLGRWTLTREQAAVLIPHCALPYWEAATAKVQLIEEAPAGVQSAILSVCFNAWIGWMDEGVCRMLNLGNWADLASEVARLHGDPRRRGIEAELVARG